MSLVWKADQVVRHERHASPTILLVPPAATLIPVVALSGKQLLTAVIEVRPVSTNVP